MRTTGGGLRWLLPLVLALIGALLLAGPARAEGTEAPAEKPPAEGVEKPAEQSGETPVEGSEKPSEPPPSESGETPPAEKQPEGGEQPPAEQQQSEPTEKTSEPPPPPEGGEQTQEAAHGEAAAGAEKTTQDAPPAPQAEQQQHASASSSSQSGATAGARGEEGEGESAGALPSSTPPVTGSSAEANQPAGAQRGSSTIVAGASGSSSQGCIPSGIEERMHASCTGGLLGGQPVLVVSGKGLAAVAARLDAVTSGAPGSDDHGRSTVSSPPVSQAPAGPPSGGSGASAPGGAGIGLAGFIGFTLLLLVATPHAVRRLALSCEPVLTSFAVLIPERPD